MCWVPPSVLGLLGWPQKDGGAALSAAGPLVRRCAGPPVRGSASPLVRRSARSGFGSAKFRLSLQGAETRLLPSVPGGCSPKWSVPGWRPPRGLKPTKFQTSCHAVTHHGPMQVFVVAKQRIAFRAFHTEAERKFPALTLLLPAPFGGLRLRNARLLRSLVLVVSQLPF